MSARILALFLIPSFFASPAAATGAGAITITNVSWGYGIVDNKPNAITVTVQASPGPGPAPTGTFTFTVNNVSSPAMPLGVLSPTSIATGEIPSLPAGNYTVVARYSGDQNYAAASFQIPLVVEGASFIYGEDFAFAATPFVSTMPLKNAATARGTVYFWEGASMVGSGPLGSDGWARVTATLASPGAHLLTVRFVGNTSIPDGSWSVKVYPRPALSASGAPAACVIGGAAAVKVTLTDSTMRANGTLTMLEAGTPLSGFVALPAGGAVTVGYPCSSLGPHTVTFQYHPAADSFRPYTVDDLFVALTVKKATLTLAPGTLQGAYGAPLAIRILMPDAPANATGTVTLYEGAAQLAAVPLSAGAASFQLTDLKAGIHAIVARFSGSTQADDLPLTVTISLAATTTRLAASGAGAVIATVGFPGPRGTGSVRLDDNGAPTSTLPLDGSGAATFPLASLAPGAHSLTATYLGDANYRSSASSPLALQVAALATATAVLGVTPESPRAGQPFDVRVRVTAGSGIPSGAVLLVEGGTTLASGALQSDGSATLRAAGLAAGAHTLTAAFQGSATFAPNSSASFTVQVAHAALTVVNAATGTAGVSPGCLASAFGEGLAAETRSAAERLPTELAGTKLTVLDAAGVSWPAPLLFVSPSQVNFLLPAEAAAGDATVTLSSASGVLTAAVALLPSAPGLFSATGAGAGPASAFLVVAHPDGTQTVTTAFQCDTSCKTVPLDLGAEGDVAVLVLYGTGFGKAAGARVRIGSSELTPDYAGPQGQFAGLDQINVALPPTLRKAGVQSISVAIGGRTSNAVEVEF